MSFVEIPVHVAVATMNRRAQPTRVGTRSNGPGMAVGPRAAITATRVIAARRRAYKGVGREVERAKDVEYRVCGNGGRAEVEESPVACGRADRRCHGSRVGTRRGGERGRRQQRHCQAAAGGPDRIACPGGPGPGLAGRACPAVLAGGPAPGPSLRVSADRARGERVGGLAGLPIRSPQGSAHPRAHLHAGSGAGARSGQRDRRDGHTLE